MPKKKRKKYPRLPSGFGSIRYLGADRRNCYAVHPPSTIDALGRVNRPAAICYVDDWIKGFTVLTAYKAGTYTPGMEKQLKVANTSDADILVQRIIADYSTLKGVEEKHPEIHEPTFSEVFEGFYKWKFEDNKSREYSKASKCNYKVAYKNCSALHNRKFNSIHYKDMQEVVDSCPLKHASLELIVTLFKQMYKYAIVHEICTDDKSKYVSVNHPEDDEGGRPFSEEELRLLWLHKDNKNISMILIMCYSGFRISEFKTLEINLEKKYFKGGMKTDAGRNRIVPIHSSIFDFVRLRIAETGCLMPISVSRYREKYFDTALSELGICSKPKHTPHDCRHTFSYLCEKYGVRENDRKRMLGHAFADVTNSVYGHRSTEDLRSEIEKIEVPFCD